MANDTILMTDTAAFKAGLAKGRKLGGGFVPNPNQSIHSASVQYIAKRDALYPFLADKIEAQRLFKAGALQGYSERIGY